MAIREPYILYHDLLANTWKGNRARFNMLLQHHWSRYSDHEKRLLHEYCYDSDGLGYAGQPYMRPNHVSIETIEAAFFNQNVAKAA